MGPNDAEIIRAYTRAVGSPVADTTLDSSADALIVIEAETGSTVFGNGAQWQLGLVVNDLVDGTQIDYTLAPTTAVSGHLNDPAGVWTSQAETFSYTIPAANLGPHKGHLCKVYAYLLVGTNATNYDSSFVESPVFLVLP
jgi:hypothetical protein